MHVTSAFLRTVWTNNLKRLGQLFSLKQTLFYHPCNWQWILATRIVGTRTANCPGVTVWWGKQKRSIWVSKKGIDDMERSRLQPYHSASLLARLKCFKAAVGFSVYLKSHSTNDLLKTILQTVGKRGYWAWTVLILHKLTYIFYWHVNTKREIATL